jgi:CheY-like chemotaxis protein
MTQPAEALERSMKDTAVTQFPQEPARAGESPAALRLLLAEDNPVSQALALAMLSKLGLRADLARDGAEAVAAVRAAAYDAVLMDVRMPEVDGLEATRRIRADGDAVYQPWIVAVTANACEDERERCLRAGMDDFVSKPFRRENLHAALERARRRAPSSGDG